MNIKVDQMQQMQQVAQKHVSPDADGSFKFTLISNIEDQGLQARLNLMMEEITMQGKKLSKHMDVRDMKKYRALIRDFMNEIVSRSHKIGRAHV